MAESLLADFTARFFINLSPTAELSPGRILLSEQRLVLVDDNGKTEISLSDVFDVAVGHVPTGTDEYFGHPVTIGYRYLGDRQVAVIAGDREPITAFAASFFKAALDGTPVWVKHPARVGGRVTDEQPVEATITLGNRAVVFGNASNPIEIDLDTVTAYERVARTVSGTTQPVLSVRHMPQNRALTTEILVESERRMNLLGRYLRLEYDVAIRELRKIDLTEGELEVLVGLYSGGDDADLARITGESASTVSMVVSDLENLGLVTTGEDGTFLTARGRMLVGEEIESVSA